VNYFSDDRTAELRELFFESAQELLQGLNEAGLELENRPGDAEIVRRVRRLVHTLKGDSAACNFHELSKLAHEMEEALQPGAAQSAGTSLVEVIFTAADSFQAMLTAYRKGVAPPAGDALRKQIRRMVQKPETQSPVVAPEQELRTQFNWSQSQRGRIAQAISAGEKVFHIALRIDPASGMRSAGFELVRKALANAGTILAMNPENVAAAETAPYIEAALATRLQKKAIAKKCHIPSVVNDIVIERAARLKEKSESELHTEPPVAEVKNSEPISEDTAHASSESLTIVPPDDKQTRQAARAAAALAAAENTLRVDVSRIDDVMNLLGELIIGKSMLHRTILEFDRYHAKDPLRARFADALAFQSRVLDDLQRSLLKIRMVPVEQLFRRFPRIVRDISMQCGKEVALEIAGENTDLDKSILDALAEPLAHLIRNAVDHGIEAPAARAKAGKPRAGVVRLGAYHQGTQVVIEISDDGRGIDRQKLTSRAAERGILSSDEAAKLSEADALRLVFEPGLSTAEKVTEVSGRGVGMDIVATALERLKGSIEVESKPGSGTKFRLLMPLTLASIQAMLFQVAGRLYAVPLANVVEITRLTQSEVHRVENYEVIQLREQLLTLVHLDPSAPSISSVPGKKSFVIVISVNDRKFGLVVDSLLGEEELVIKALDDRLAQSELVSGASILGDGTVVLILNIVAVTSRLARLPVLGAIA
jgi:two-component system, chemotaxis family, sensor kinase CheA